MLQSVEIEAERFCADMARREAKNFYWGFISLPYDQRMAIYALYDFARQVDDEVDGAPSPELVPQRLHAQRARLMQSIDADDHVMLVLSRAVQRYNIPHGELLALIDGVERDLNTTRYETWEDLKAYCHLVASIVGRMCVRIFVFTEDAALHYADQLGLALQLTNILRDVREDAGMGRIYLPQEELHRYEISEEALMNASPGAGWEPFVEFQTHRARALFADGYQVLRYIPRRAGACVQTMAGIYEGILRKIEREPHLPLRERAALTRSEKLRVVVESWLRPQV